MCRATPKPATFVDDRDWSILKRRRFEKLVLAACHPLHSASQRIAVFARLSPR